jgi:hypothetical protein
MIGALCIFASGAIIGGVFVAWWKDREFARWLQGKARS